MQRQSNTACIFSVKVASSYQFASGAHCKHLIYIPLYEQLIKKIKRALRHPFHYVLFPFIFIRGEALPETLLICIPLIN